MFILVSPFPATGEQTRYAFDTASTPLHLLFSEGREKGRIIGFPKELWRKGC